MMGNKYRYFVAYHVNDGVISGFGNLQVSVTKKISSVKEIVEISDMIVKDHGYKKGSVVVITYQEFPEE